MKQPAVYIVTNKRNGTLYTGVTANLIERIYTHKLNVMDEFTRKYGCKLLVFYELHTTMETAIMREKQLKKGSRQNKINIIEAMNPNWHDLYEDIAKFS